MTLTRYSTNNKGNRTPPTGREEQLLSNNLAFLHQFDDYFHLPHIGYNSPSSISYKPLRDDCITVDVPVRAPRLGLALFEQVDHDLEARFVATWTIVQWLLMVYNVIQYQHVSPVT
jgi:hypothetical protein